MTQSPLQINGFTSSLSVGLLATAAISMCPAKGMAAPEAAATGAAGRPNFLILVTDDQSFAHTSFNGNPVVKTPAFDRVARNGVNFVNAFCSAPSCSPSRAAILTGRNFYELGPGAVLFSGFPEDPTFQDLLRNHGYFAGYTGKPWGPGFWAGSGRTVDPVGLDYNDLKLEAPKEISDSDYFGNFKAFLQDRPQGQPFSFWFGAREPHLPYAFGRGEAGGKKLADVVLPPHLVDTPGTRHQFLDYYDEIEWVDGHLARMLDYLAEIGELDNTVVLVTSDNGLSMPRGKGDLYDAGVRMPLAVMWINSVKGGRTMTDFVSLADIAPTVLELAGIEIPPTMSARSIAPLLLSDNEGRVDETRDRVVVGVERHDTYYPMRALRTDDYLLIRNHTPGVNRREDFWKRSEASPGRVNEVLSKGLAYDPLMWLFHDPAIRPKALLAYGPRPEWELYDVRKDPWSMQNLADNPELAATKDALKKKMEDYLTRTGDPRMTGTAEFDKLPHYGKIPESDTATREKVREWQKIQAQSHRRLRAAIPTLPSRPTGAKGE